MKIEDLEKAAGDYSGKALGLKGFPNVDLKYKSFTDGAKWRINSVWHGIYEQPEQGELCIVEYSDGNGNLTFRIDKRSEFEWIEMCHYDKILRWAYIKDLIPNE